MKVTDKFLSGRGQGHANSQSEQSGRVWYRISWMYLVKLQFFV